MKQSDDKEISNRPVIALVGNGINRCFEQGSWAQVIEDIISKSGCSVKYEDIKNIPAPMQVVVASNDHVDTHMKEFASKLMETEISLEQKTMLKDILDKDFDAILTTNYSYEFEQAAGIKRNRNSYYKCRHWTKEPLKRKEKLLHLYEYNDADKNRIWHIHGDICTPRSIIMGHYYYGKLLSEIEQYTSSLLQRYNNPDTEFECKSWVDLFVTGNIHMIGFGLDLSESDIWWLLCYKHRHFPETKVYFYEAKKNISLEKRLMLETYGVTIVDDKPLKNNDYTSYYQMVISSLWK